MKKNTIVVSAFPGKGKTYQFNHQTELKISDSDSSKFHWIVGEDGKRMENPNFIQYYIDYIKNTIESKEYDVIFVSSHSDVRKALKINGIKYFLVYGYYNEKKQYIDLYRQRGNSDKFIENMENNYYQYIENMDQEIFPYKIKLHHDEFITLDMLKSFLEYQKIWNISTKANILELDKDKDKEILSKINWTRICQCERIPTGKLVEFADYLDFDTLYMYQDVPEKFAKSHITNIRYMLKYQKFSKDFKSKLKNYYKYRYDIN